MTYKLETLLSYAALSETISMTKELKKLPPENQKYFLEFWRGVTYGLDVAGVLLESAQAGT